MYVDDDSSDAPVRQISWSILNADLINLPFNQLIIGLDSFEIVMVNEALQMYVMDVRDKPVKMAKKVDGFLAALCPKYQAWGEF